MKFLASILALLIVIFFSCSKADQNAPPKLANAHCTIKLVAEFEDGSEPGAMRRVYIIEDVQSKKRYIAFDGIQKNWLYKENRKDLP